MGYSPRCHKESDMTERLTLWLSLSTTGVTESDWCCRGRRWLWGWKESVFSPTWRMEGETQCSAPPVWQPLGHTLSLLQWMSSWWPLPSLSGMIPTNICCPAVTINGVLLLLQACPSWDRQHHRDHSSIGIITPLQRQSNWGLESLYNLPLFTKPMADTSIWGQTLFLWASAVSSRKESDSLWSPHSLLEHRY